VTVSFQDGGSPTFAYAGARDTRISAVQPDKNYGTSTTLWANGADGNVALLKWENLNIPAGSMVKAATLTLNVTLPSNGTYNLHALKHDWTQSQATWNVYSTRHNWEVPGAQGTADRGTTVLGTVAAPSTGQYTITLNASGVALVQSWIDEPNKNRGIILDNPAVTDDLAFDSREAVTASTRPKLTITYKPQ